jgi:OOP family OmpA-OmpF porin
LIFVAIAAALATGASFAQDTKNQGYVVDQRGNIVTSANTGLCWRTSAWTPARAVAQCDPVMKVAAVPQPIAAAAPPPPPPAAKPPAPAVAKPAMTRKINFSADVLFDFDKATIKAEGKTLLDNLATDLKGAQYEVIIVTGHTDRFGSTEYNQKLSERRAQAVKDYLIGRDIQANRVRAEGKGESSPETKAGDCAGAKSAKVIACLQPDRRVDVEVTGSKEEAAGSR